MTEKVIQQAATCGRCGIIYCRPVRKKNLLEENRGVTVGDCQWKWQCGRKVIESD